MAEKTRQDAWKLMTEYTASESLRRHMLAVEAAMRAYAHKFGEDEDHWGMAGLLHDFDYEQHPNPEWKPDPNEHPLFGSRILEEQGYPEDVIYAIKTHAEYLGLPRTHLMDKALFAVDELVGFLTAMAYVRPSRNLANLELSSVRKKLRDKAFARAVSRDDITRGAQELGVELDEHVQTVAKAMQEIGPSLGFAPAADS